jgi:transcriptional regulator with XRE-family HTH domain
VARLNKRNAIGLKIAEIRRERGWSRDELAAQLALFGCNITSQNLAVIETCQRPVTHAQLVFFAEAFQVPVSKMV